jgi:hypothetical protein
MFEFVIISCFLFNINYQVVVIMYGVEGRKGMIVFWVINLNKR